MKQHLHCEHWSNQTGSILIRTGLWNQVPTWAGSKIDPCGANKSKSTVCWKIGDHINWGHPGLSGSAPPRDLKHPASYMSPVGQQIVLMFNRSVWKLNLTLCVVWHRRRGRDIICWIFTPVSARRKQQQERTWPPQTAVSRKQTHTVCFSLTHTGFTHAGLHCLHRLQQSVHADTGRTVWCQMLTNED